MIQQEQIQTYKYTNILTVIGLYFIGKYVKIPVILGNNAIAISDDGTKIVAGGLYANVNPNKDTGYVQAWQWSAKSYGPLIDISGETVIFGKRYSQRRP